MKSYQITTIIIFSLFLLYGCTYTQSYQPEFNVKKTAVIDSLKTKYGFEDISFLGKRVSSNGAAHTSLTVKFINGKTIPADTAQITGLEKLLGSRIKTIVKHPADFDTYIILLDKVKVDGNTTTDDYTGHEYKSAEL